MTADLLEVQQKLAETLHQRAVLEASEDFYVFVKLLAPLMLDGNEYRDGRHIEALAATFQDIEAGEIMRQMIMLPPGSMKSVLLMLFAAWCLGRHPSWRLMWISHNADKAQECSGRIRDLLRSEEYLEVFPAIRIREDMSGVTMWKLVTGGSFRPAGAGSGIAGYRFNLGIIDDPLSEQSAFSDTERNKINVWYPRGFRSRKLPDSRIILVNTRWHTNDLSGYLLHLAKTNKRADQWNVISIPAILDQESADYLMLPVGTSYWPEYITLEDLKSTQESMPRSDWAALYLQSPFADSGNIFAKDDFQDWTWDDPPECVEIIQTLDTAFSKRDHADWSVIQTWGIFWHDVEKQVDGFLAVDSEAHVILLNAVKGRWSYPELRAEARAQYRRYKPDRMVIENKASGQSLIQDLRLNGLPVLPFQPDRDKVARAHAASGIVTMKRVWIPLKKKYGAELLQEALEFPKGTHDDSVDAMVMALLYLRRKYELSQEKQTKWGDEAPARKRGGYWKGVKRASRYR